MTGIARKKQRMLMAVFALLLACGAASAGENTLTYQGVLRDAAGDAVADGPYNMSFSIHTAEAVGAGALVWGPEAHAGVAVTQGSFSVVLGGTVPLGDLFAQQSEVFLEVAVDTGSGAQPFSPRVALNASPYALGGKAQNIRYDNTASGLAATNAQSAITELDGRIDSLESVSAPVQSVFGRTGAVTAQSGDYNAAKIANTPSGNVAATNVQAALNELDGEKSAVGHTHLGSAITSQVSSAANADNAAHATSADNATHATAADSATNAGHATSADSATDAEHVPWGGISNIPPDLADGDDNSGGDITAVAAGAGLTGGATAGDATLSANFAGNGTANTVAHSDHNHDSVYANSSHTHNGSDINAGTVGYNYLPVGTGSTQVAAGNHTHNSLTGPGGSPANAAFVDASGNMGVGTVTPGARLEVNGGLKFTGDSAVGNQTTGITYKAARTYQICDPRPGCPSTPATPDTNDLFGQTIVFEHSAVVYANATLISFGTGRRDLAIYLDGGELQRSIVNTGTASAEVSANCIWTGVVSAGSHRFSVGVQNFCGTGCTRSWGCGCGHGQLNLLVLE